MSAPVFGAIDDLDLGAGWEPQGGDPADNSTRATTNGPDGDIVAENQHNTIEGGSTNYIYTGAETGFAAALLAATAQPGRLVDTNTLFILSVGIDYSPCAEGKRPLVTFNWRDGPTAAPATPFWYASTIVLPTYVVANVEIPELLTITGGDAELQSADWSLACLLGDDLDKDGDFLAGQGYQGVEIINMQFVGTPTSITSTGWIETSAPGSNAGEVKENTGYGTSSYSFTRKVTRST